MVSAYISHGVLSGPAVERINASVLTEVVITDSIEAPDRVSGCGKHSPVIGRAVDR